MRQIRAADRHDPAGPDELAHPVFSIACRCASRSRSITASAGGPSPSARRAAGRGTHPIARPAAPRVPASALGRDAAAGGGGHGIAAPPRLLIADEPTTSLDLRSRRVPGPAQGAQQRHRFALIFVTHNLGIVAKICDRVAVMYAGRIVEMGRCGASSPARASIQPGAARVHPPARRARGAPHRHRGQPPDLARLPAAAPSLPAARTSWSDAGGGAARAARRRREVACACWLERGVSALLEVEGLTKHFPVRRAAGPIRRTRPRGRCDLGSRSRRPRWAWWASPGAGKTTSPSGAGLSVRPGGHPFQGEDSWR